jgi:alanyl-tRNA synthetase
LQGKKLGKSVYVISADEDANKVVHINFVDPGLKSNGIDARTWATHVAGVVGGKAGGKEDGAQGAGTDVTKVDEAVKSAREFLSGVIA